MNVQCLILSQIYHFTVQDTLENTFIPDQFFIRQLRYTAEFIDVGHTGTAGWEFHFLGDHKGFFSRFQWDPGCIDSFFGL